MKTKVAKYIADFFAGKGAKLVFSVTGGGAMHLNDAFGHHETLQCVYNHHEQASAMAAESYTVLTGEPAVVCVTSGPGGTNALTGVLGGWLDSVPMFIVSGQVKTETTTWITDVPLRQLGDQEYNIVESVRPMTKYAVMVTDPTEIAYHLEKAYFLAFTGRGGPVWLDIPLNIQGAMIETDALKHFQKEECLEALPQPISQELAQTVLDKIAASKRPVILAGTGIRLGHAHEEFMKVIEKLRIPVVTAWNAHDTLWNDHPLFCGKPGTVGTRGGNFVVENSDLVLTLGCRLNIRQISYNYKNWAKNAFKIINDIDPNELKKPTLQPDLPVCGDVKELLVKMQAGAYTPSGDHKAWLAQCRNTNARYPAVKPCFYEKQSPINPYVFADKIFAHLKEDDAVICGNGSACVVGFQAANVKKGQRLFTNSGCASMGYGFPAALGCSFGRPGKRTVCFDGDGSIMMNLQELQTAVHHQAEIKTFLFNNNGYHSCRQTQTNLFKPPLVGATPDSGVSFPDFGKIAAAFGLNYVRIENLGELDEKIEMALSMPGPVICEGILDPTQFFEPKLSSKVLPDGKIVSPPIDDMYPFLCREEYLSNKI